MRKVLRILLTLSLLAAVAGCGKRGRVIPMNTFSEIYADMFIADEWIRTHDQYRRQADTTLFYEPIFRRYGYSFADYNASVQHYLKDPVRFSKVFRQSAKVLRRRQKRYIDKAEELRQNRLMWAKIKDFSRLDFEKDSLLYRQYDSVRFWTLDSLTRDSILRARFVLDSLYRDSILRDSLIRDSIVRDSLQRDSLLRVKKKKHK